MVARPKVMQHNAEERTTKLVLVIIYLPIPGQIPVSTGEPLAVVGPVVGPTVLF